MIRKTVLPDSNKLKLKEIAELSELDSGNQSSSYEGSYKD